jgi:asparagine synthase (glutamine-hydrolysing)
LRVGLEERGHRFTTGVDTEVIPHLYEEQGAELVHALNGMFALAVWDAPRQTLLLARDRAGEKPLFWWRGSDGELAFASELRALLAHPRIVAKVDPVALRRYLLHDYFPAPLTPFAGIHKLPAGHLLVAKDGEITVRSYWDLADYFGNDELARRSTTSLVEELDGRLSLAVERRRRSDVPVGVYLSGGIDSSTVLAHMSDQVGPGVPVFAFGHQDPDFDESRFARETARFFKADFHELVVGDAELAEGLRMVGKGFDEPLGDASIVPSHLLALFARQRVKVVLSGEGADELFAGYPTYLGHRLAGVYRRLPGPLRRGLLSALKHLPARMGNVSPAYLLSRFAAAAERPLVERHHTWFGSLGPSRLDGVLAPRITALLADDDPFGSARARLEGRNFPDDLSRLLYTDFTMYLQDDLLTKVDRATMLASLEARAPFLDHELAQFAAGLPSRHKVSGFTTKALLRQAVKARLPKEVLARRKRGFTIPFSRWLLRGLGDELRQRFAPERVEARGLLHPQGLQRLLDEHLSRQHDHRKPLFTLLALDLWCDEIFGEAAPIPLAEGAREALPLLEVPA